MDTDDLTVQFRAHLATGHLHIQRCNACSRWRHIPRFMCPVCGSPEWVWQPVVGTGRLFSWTTTERALHPDFREVPYTVAIIELDEGPHLVARLVMSENLAPRVGMAVSLKPNIGEVTSLVPEFQSQAQKHER